MRVNLRLHLGIRAKFVFLITGILVIIFATIASYLARSTTATLRANLYDEARSFATLASQPIGSVYAIYNDAGTLNIDREINNFAKLDKRITNITIIDIVGKVLYQQNKQDGLVINSSQAESFEPIYIYDMNSVLQTIVYPYKESNGIRRFSIVYSVSGASIDESVRSATKSVVFLSLVGLVTTIILIYFFINYWLIRKIRRVSHQSTLISSGRLDQEVEVSSNDEIGDLARSVNTMADSLKADITKLKELDKAKSEFMMVTSHNLRTPLTIINGFIETAEDFTTVEELRTALQQIAAGSKRLSVFAEDVLTISRLEMGEKIQALETVDVSEFLSAISQDFEKLSRLKHVVFSDDLPPISKRILVNRPYMRAAVWNLLDNALKFTGEGGHIELGVTDKGDRAEISVRDTGIGISPDEIQKLFTKFHRGTGTLTYNYEGTGIGLYATKMIIDRLGGEVHVQSEQGAGSYFTILLPFINTAPLPPRGATTTP